jgi:DNA-binding NarL/FixJ family response regulator
MLSTKKRKASARRMRILVVDCHPLVRCGLRALLAGEEDLEVCGEAKSTDDAMHRLRELQPDLVIVDISAELGNGFDFVQRVKEQYKATKTLVSSIHEEASYAERALRAGASGYVSAQENSDQFVDAIRNVLRGKIYLSNAMTEHFLHRAANHADEHHPDALQLLSTRELSVFELIGGGHTTRQVADKLHLSIKTIETYREKIKAKLGLANGTQLVRHATKWVLDLPTRRNGYKFNGHS